MLKHLFISSDIGIIYMLLTRVQKKITERFMLKLI